MGAEVKQKGDKNANNNQLHMHASGQCDICHRKTGNLRALVSNGQFYQGVCDLCRGGSNLTPIDAKYQKERAKEDYAKETLQPYKNGKANPDFIIAYPDLKDMFTAEELENV
jgi:hypothetical protein